MSRPHTIRSVVSPLLYGLLAAVAAPLGGCTTSGPGESSTEPDRAGFDEIVYAVRQTTVVNGKDVQIDVADGMGQVMDYGRYVPGARLEVRNIRTGDVRNLIDDKRYDKADIEGMDLSFDAKKVVFAMKLDGNDHYHVYKANLAKGADTKNPYGIAQLTFGPQDDLTPIWLASGNIAFISNQMYTDMGTRADEYNHGRRVTQIGTISEVGGDSDRKLCSQNLSHVFNLFRMKSGQIGYSRWEHLENVNDSKLFAMNPDCTQMIALAGQHDKPANSLVQVTEGLDRNVFFAVATDRERTLQAGALVSVDARSAVDDARHDEERATFTVLTPSVPRGGDVSPIGRYRSPHILPDGRLLVSWADGWVNDVNELSATPPDFGIYIYDPKTRKNQLVYNDKDTWELYAQPVAPQVEPPLLSSVQTSQDSTRPLVIGSIDVRQTSLFTLHQNSVQGAQFIDSTPMDQALGSAVKVRIIEGFSSEAAPNVTMFGLTMAEGAAILGEAPVLADGSWRASVPPFIPMHLQAVDEFDLAIRSQTTWIQGMPGESRVCGGCHEERTTANRPTAQQQPLAATQIQDYMLPIGDRTEYPWQMTMGGTVGANSLEIQQLLDAKCVQCHNADKNGNDAQEKYVVTMTDRDTGEKTPYTLSRLDLSSKPITVTYDRRTAMYPASYVSIFYPAALEMEMGQGATITMGSKPPKWGVPSDARHSLLIEKLNMTSAFDGNKNAWALGQAFSDSKVTMDGYVPMKGGTRSMHPENVGGPSLSREERRALIRTFDMGGQFYSRQNTGFKAYTANTVAPAAGNTNAGPSTMYPMP
jgi:cytochrome c553